MTADRHADAPAIVDRYLAELDRHLAVSGRYRRRVLLEVADHLDEAIAANPGGGDADAVAAEVVRRFGPADRLAGQINAGWASARARRAPAFAFLGGAGVVAAAAAGIPTAPASAGPDGGASVAVFATVAFLALQLAVVAGAVSLLRVLARRSALVLLPADRAVVWRAARLCVAATATAALAFLGVAALQSHRTGDGAGPVVIAAIGMLAVLAPVALVLRHPRSVPGNGAADSDGGLSAEFGERDLGRSPGLIERLARLAERVVSLVRRWPGSATALLAGVCAVGSYGHAETGRLGSLVAASVEAAAVLVFARLFGPTLDLRVRTPSPQGGGSSVSG